MNLPTLPVHRGADSLFVGNQGVLSEAKSLLERDVHLFVSLFVSPCQMIAYMVSYKYSE